MPSSYQPTGEASRDLPTKTNIQRTPQMINPTNVIGSSALATNVSNQTHLACVNKACVSVNGTGVDECLNNSDCYNQSKTHLECRNQACVLVAGFGEDKCKTNAQCKLVPVTPTIEVAEGSTALPTSKSHLICRNEACVRISGPGKNECANDNQCKTTYTKCVNMACAVFNGTRDSECSVDDDCRHLACVNNTLCTHVPGAGNDTCQVNSDCSPNDPAPSQPEPRTMFELIVSWFN